MLRQGLSFLVVHGGAGISIGVIMKKLICLVLVLCAALCAMPIVASSLEITVFTPGDVNVDRVVDEKDAELLLDYLGGVQSPEAKKPDVNRDGVVNNVDAVLLLQYLAGYDVTLYEDPDDGWTDNY